jgi:hypothetical protein
MVKGCYGKHSDAIRYESYSQAKPTKFYVENGDESNVYQNEWKASKPFYFFFAFYRVIKCFRRWQYPP